MGILPMLAMYAWARRPCHGRRDSGLFFHFTSFVVITFTTLLASCSLYSGV